MTVYADQPVRAAEDMTVEEYMQWVRHEAMQCPQVLRVEIRAKQMESTQLVELDYGATPQRLTYMEKIGQRRSLPIGPDWAQPRPRCVSYSLHILLLSPLSP